MQLVTPFRTEVTALVARGDPSLATLAQDDSEDAQGVRMTALSP